MSEEVFKPKVKLEILVDGKKVFEKDDDLLVRNFNRAMYMALSGLSTTIKLEDGRDLTPGRTNVGTAYSIFLSPCKVAIGTGTTPPSMTDFKLESKYMETTSLVIAPYYEEGTMLRFDIIANFTINENITLYEFGLFYYTTELIGTTHYLRVFLVSRDVVSEGIPVTAGQVISIVYRWVIGS